MNNRNKMKWYPVVIVFFVLFVHCTEYDAYKKYMPDGEITYPQKADAVTTYPGKNRIQLEWVIVDPKVTSCKVFYQQEGIQNEITVPINVGGNRENDTIRLIIPNLEETTCMCQIVSYDDFGHTSIPVEVDELAYGAIYEQTLSNRILKSLLYDDDSNALMLEWFNAIDDTETGMELTYTDMNDNTQTLFFAGSETSTALPDFKLGEPLYISTMYKPAPLAIDIFSADPQRVLLQATINVALQKPVTVSDFYATYEGSWAVDGDKDTENYTSRWISDLDNNQFAEHWIEIDLQDYYPIYALRLIRMSHDMSMPMWRFQAWIDDDWVNVVSYDNNSTLDYYEEFEPVTTNKVRWYLPAYANNSVRLFEIEVYSLVTY